MARTESKPKPTTRLTEPAADGIIEETSIADLVRGLIEGLGHKVNDVAELQVSKGGRIRVLGRDRSFRGHMFDYPKDEEAAE